MKGGPSPVSRFFSIVLSDQPTYSAAGAWRSLRPSVSIGFLVVSTACPPSMAKRGYARQVVPRNPSNEAHFFRGSFGGAPHLAKGSFDFASAHGVGCWRFERPVGGHSC